LKTSLRAATRAPGRRRGKMKAKVYAENYITGEKRYIGKVLYDNASRAIKMYQDDAEADEEIVLIDEAEER